ncbi:MAG: hypothetical protein JST11_10200 [Acidobacteria bacterium]|nr:hypothetical protein [Acidobacteriota bacterium]
MFDSPRWQWTIVRFEEYAKRDVLLEIPERDEAADFLRRFKEDAEVMGFLRGLLEDLYPVFLLTDDEVVAAVAWRIAERQLFLVRKKREFRGSHGGNDPDKPDPHHDGPGPNGPDNPNPPPKPKKSWFAVTVVSKVGGSQKVVDGMSVMCQLPDTGQVSGTLTKGSPRVRWDDLEPGGTGTVVSTSHSEVWEVDEDIE